LVPSLVGTRPATNTVLAQRTGHRRFNFDQESERAAMGYLLGRISDREFGRTGVLISAIVNYLDANDADPGFYKLAQENGLLPRGQSRARQWEFWATMSARCSLHTGGNRPPHGGLAQIHRQSSGCSRPLPANVG
jgi:hypothetical protein